MLFDDYWYSKIDLITEFAEWLAQVSARPELHWDQIETNLSVYQVAVIQEATGYRKTPHPR